MTNETNRSETGAGKPSSDDLRLAAEWLSAYEGDDAARCALVAAWLNDQADAKELRDAAREHGIPVKALRKKLAVRS